MFTPIRPCTDSLPATPLTKAMRYISRRSTNARPREEKEDLHEKNTTTNITIAKHNERTPRGGALDESGRHRSFFAAAAQPPEKRRSL